MRFTRVLLNVGEKFAKARSVLSVDVGATETQIHKAYLSKAKLYHPDSTQLIDGIVLDKHEKRLRFDEISEAYNLLMNNDGESSTEVEDAHEVSDSGFPRISSIAYAKHILGVEPNATKEEVDRAYRQLCLVYHPDLANDEDLIDVNYFNTLTKAYQTFQNQHILKKEQIFYENIMEDNQFTIEARKHIAKSRRSSEETFFGWDTAVELKPKAMLKKLSRLASDMRQDYKNRDAERYQWNGKQNK